MPAAKPPRKNPFREHQSLAEKASQTPSPTPTSESQRFAIKTTILYQFLQKGVRIVLPAQEVWSNKALADAWLRKYPRPTWTHLYGWMRKVGQETLDETSQELGLPDQPHIAPPATLSR